jgi:hypothetical protein
MGSVSYLNCAGTAPVELSDGFQFGTVLRCHWRPSPELRIGDTTADVSRGRK